MSGIPVYTSSPLKASKPSGSTPQTANAEAQHSPLALDPNTSSATTIASTSSYLPAKPGTAAFPAPTSEAQQRYAPVRPTPTAKTDSGPQPRAVPAHLNKIAVAPPPKMAESYRSQQTGAAEASSTYTYPPQLAYAPPTTTYGSHPRGSSTRIADTPSVSYPVAIASAETGPRRSLEHPPGYHQNVYASELTSNQRRAQETEQAKNFSGLGTQDTGIAGGFDSEGVWSTAKKWAQTAGQKISVAEAEVWKKINKE